MVCISIRFGSLFNDRSESIFREEEENDHDFLGTMLMHTTTYYNIMLFVQEKMANIFVYFYFPPHHFHIDVDRKWLSHDDDDDGVFFFCFIVFGRFCFIQLTAVHSCYKATKKFKLVRSF